MQQCGRKSYISITLINIYFIRNIVCTNESRMKCAGHIAYIGKNKKGISCKFQSESRCNIVTAIVVRYRAYENMTFQENSTKYTQSVF
jgi:hypothetical protein